MPEFGSKRCLLLVDSPEGIRRCELTLPPDACIADALAAARVILGEQAAAWDRATTGIYGRVLSREHVFADGERIELYRPLTHDPREARRQRGKLSGRGAPKRPPGVR